MTDRVKELLYILRDESNCNVLDYVDDAADLLESLAAELEQVKKERDGLNVILGQAQSMLETRTRERDAALKDIPRACGYCKHYLGDSSFVNCEHECINISGINTGWEWRGVQEENQ